MQMIASGCGAKRVVMAATTVIGIDSATVLFFFCYYVVPVGFCILWGSPCSDIWVANTFVIHYVINGFLHRKLVPE